MRPTFAYAEVRLGVIELTDDCQDKEAIIPIRSVVSVDVDWLVAGGKVTIYTSQAVGGSCVYDIVFAAGDHGQAASEFISDLMKALMQSEGVTP